MIILRTKGHSIECVRFLSLVSVYLKYDIMDTALVSFYFIELMYTVTYCVTEGYYELMHAAVSVTRGLMAPWTNIHVTHYCVVEFTVVMLSIRE